MRAEEDVPIQERFLWVEGRLSGRAQRMLRNGLPSKCSEKCRICFVGYAYADLDLPKEFNTMFWVNTDQKVRDWERSDCTSFRPHHLASSIQAVSRIIAVTQQFSIPEPAIPDGWKTVCLIEFPDGVPEMIDRLPEVNAWFESRFWTVLCDSTTLAALTVMDPC